MKEKSEAPKPPVEKRQKEKCGKILEESLFFGNSFFLTGQNLAKTCREKTKIEGETQSNFMCLSPH